MADPVSTSSAALAGIAPSLVAFIATPEDTQSVRDQLGRLGSSPDRIMTGGVGAALSWCAEHPLPDVIVVDLSSDPLPLPSLTELCDLCPPQHAIITLGDRQDVDVYRMLRRAGSAEHLIKPVTLDSWAETFRRIQADEDATPALVRSGKTIAVTGAAGGVGVSTLCAALAQCLSQDRHIATSVVDFDRTNGDLPVLLGQASEAGLDAALRSDAIDARFLHRSAVQINARLHMLAQRPDWDSALQPADIDQVLMVGATLCQMFTQNIWDLPAGRPAGSLDVLRHADARIIVTDLTVPAARNVYQLLDTIGGEQDGQRLLVVLNQSRFVDGAPIRQSQFEEFIGRPVDVGLPYGGPGVARSLLEGPLDLTRAPALLDAVRTLADHICGLRPRQEKPRGLLRRLLRRTDQSASSPLTGSMA